MTRQQRREARGRQVESARYAGMVNLLRARMGAGLVTARNAVGGGFACFHVKHTAPGQWECGDIEARGGWTGGGARLRDAVDVLMFGGA